MFLTQIWAFNKAETFKEWVVLDFWILRKIHKIAEKLFKHVKQNILYFDINLIESGLARKRGMARTSFAIPTRFLVAPDKLDWYQKT